MRRNRGESACSLTPPRNEFGQKSLRIVVIGPFFECQPQRLFPEQRWHVFSLDLHDDTKPLQNHLVVRQLAHDQAQ